MPWRLSWADFKKKEPWVGSYLTHGSDLGVFAGESWCDQAHGIACHHQFMDVV